MAQIIGGIGTSHVPAIGAAIAKGAQNDPYWKPFFDGYAPAREWLKDNPPDVAVVFYNDHGLNFFLDAMPTFAVGAANEYCNADEGWGLPVLRPFQGDADFSWKLIEHLVEEAVEGIVVVLSVAVKTPFVKKHAVEHAALFACGGRLGDEFATAPGDLVERVAAMTDIELRRNGACEQQRAGFKFVIQRTDKTGKLGDGIAEIELIEETGGVAGQDAVRTVGDALEKLDGGPAEERKLGEQRLARGGAGVVDQTQQRVLLCGSESCSFHEGKRKTFPRVRNP